MEELISRIMAAARVDREVARNAIGIILGFLDKQGAADKMQLIFDALPGTKELVDERAQADSGGGLFGGLAGKMGGTMGAMAVLNELSNAGLDMKGIQSVAKELVTYAKEKAGDDIVNEVVSRIPGLNQIV